jgi:hypothetical protein
VTRTWCLTISLALSSAGCGSTSELPDARLPVSTSSQPVPLESVHIMVSATALFVDGDRVVRLDGSSVPERAMQGKLITPLHGALVSSDHATSDRVVVELDKDHDATLLTQILFTAGEAQLSAPWLVVRGPDGRASVAITLPDRRTAAATASTPSRSSSERAGYANPVVTIDPNRGYLMEVRDKVYGDEIELRCTSSPCTSWPTTELNRLSRRLKLDHPRDRAVLLAPTANTDVQAIVSAMDATRNDAVTARGARELFPTALVGVGGVQ